MKIFIFNFIFLLIVINHSYAIEKGTVKGKIVDSVLNESISGVNVFLFGTYLGTTTDNNGFYYLENVPEGEYKIIFSMVGYKDQEKLINIKKSDNISLNINLIIDPIQLSKVQIIAEKYNKEKLSSRIIDMDEISVLPTLGEQDIFHAIQTLPGVVVTNDYTKKLYVRGGDASQTTLLLDNIPIYNYLHIIGLFSPFHIDAIDNTELISSGISAKYGESASGVLKIDTKNKVEKFSSNIDVTLINSKIYLEGSNNKFDYILALRRSYTDVIFPVLFDFPFPITVTDILGKLIININKYNKMKILSFYSNDNIKDYDSDNPASDTKVISENSWGNKVISLQWNYSKNKYLLNIRSGVSLNTMYTPISSEFYVDNKIKNLTTSIENTYLISDRNLISWGFNYYKYLYDYYWDYSGYSESEYLQDDEYSTLETYSFFDNAPLHYNKIYTISFPSLFFEWTNKLTDPVTIIMGLRFTSPKKNQHLVFDPKLQVTYKVLENISLKGNISRQSQCITTAKEVGGFDFTYSGLLNAYDAWFPLLKPYKPIISDHYASGIQWNIKNLIQINIEGYFKTFKNIVAAVDSVPNFIQGNGHAEGLEILIEKKTSRTNLFLSYTLSRTVKNIAGEIYYPNYDKRHDFDGQFSVIFPKEITIAVHLKWCTGTPYTPIVGQSYTRYYYNDHLRKIEYIKGEKNSERYNDYIRLDFQMEKKTRIFNKPAEVFFQVYNITNQKNILYYKDLRASGVVRKRLYSNDYTTQFPIIPSIGIKIFL